MKKITLITFFTLFACLCFSQNNVLKAAFDVRKISFTKWDTHNGILYTQVPGANLGPTSFEVLDKNRIAFLCNSSNEIIVISSTNGEVISRFPVEFAPRDFSYDRGQYYILSEFNVDIYDESGKIVNNLSFSNTHVGIERITRFNNSTFLLLPSGNSLMIESNGKPIEPKKIDGWITSSGYRVVSKISGSNTYNVTLYSLSGVKSDCEFRTEKAVAGVFVIGTSSNRVLLDVQTYLSENPISVERKIVSVGISDSCLNKIVTEIVIPNVYYVLSNKDFSVSPQGQTYNMITTPKGVFIFSLSEPESEKEVIHPYPDFITKESYQFNDHLLKVEEN